MMDLPVRIRELRLNAILGRGLLRPYAFLVFY